MYVLRQLSAVDPRLQRSSKQTRAFRSLLLPLIDPKADDPYDHLSIQERLEIAIGLSTSNVKKLSLKEQDIMYRLKKESEQ